MTRIAKLMFAVAFVFAGLSAAPQRAHAAPTSPVNGYVCYVWDQWGPGLLGTAGGLAVSIYSQPGCTGTFLAFALIGTPGTTPTYCPSSALVDESRLESISHNLVLAGGQSQRISAYIDPINPNQPCITSLIIQGK
jgi:hypothetical protein